MSLTGLVKSNLDTESSEVSLLVNADLELESLLSYDAEGSSYEEDLGDHLSSTTTVDPGVSPNTTNKVVNTGDINKNHNLQHLLGDLSSYRGGNLTSSTSSTFNLGTLSDYHFPTTTSINSSRAASFAQQEETRNITDSTTALIEELIIDLGVDEEVSNAEIHAQELAYQQEIFEEAQRDRRFTLEEIPEKDIIAASEIITLKMHKIPKLAIGDMRQRSKILSDSNRNVNLAHDGDTHGVVSYQKPGQKTQVPTLQSAPKPSAVIASHRSSSEKKASTESSDKISFDLKNYTGRQSIDELAGSNIARAIFGDTAFAQLDNNFDYSFELFSDGKALDVSSSPANTSNAASQTIEVVRVQVNEEMQTIEKICKDVEMQYEKASIPRKVLIVESFDKSPRDRYPAIIKRNSEDGMDVITLVKPVRPSCLICLERIQRASMVDIQATKERKESDDIFVRSSGTEVDEKERHNLKEISYGSQEVSMNETMYEDEVNKIDLQPGSDEEQAVNALRILSNGASATAEQLNIHYTDVQVVDEFREESDELELDEKLQLGGNAVTVQEADILGTSVSALVVAESVNQINMSPTEAAAQDEEKNDVVFVKHTKTRAEKKKEEKLQNEMYIAFVGPRKSGRNRQEVNYSESSRSRGQEIKIKQEQDDDRLMTPPPPPTPPTLPTPSSSSPSPFLSFTGERQAKRKAAEIISSSSHGCLYGKSTNLHPKKKSRKTA